MLWAGVYAVLETRNVIVPCGLVDGLFAAACVSRIDGAHLLALAARAPMSRATRRCARAAWPACWTAGSGSLLFAASLLIVFGVAHFYRDAHAAIGRLGALPIVPLFGLYTVASVLASDPAAVPKLETMRSMVLVGWMIALVFAVVLAAYVARAASAGSGTLGHLAALIVGWALCLGYIVASAKIAAALATCSQG